jgi:hypothetical protein
MHALLENETLNEALSSGQNSPLLQTLILFACLSLRAQTTNTSATGELLIQDFVPDKVKVLFDAFHTAFVSMPAGFDP